MTGSGVGLPVLLDPEGEHYWAYDRSGGETYAPYPLQVLIDREGVVRDISLQADPQETHRFIAELLAE